MKKEIKTEKIRIYKGITIITLAVTVVVVTILTGVMISVVKDDEGIIEKTSTIKNAQQKNTEKEILDQDLINVRNKYTGKVSIHELEEEFDKNSLLKNNDGTSTIQYDITGDGIGDIIAIITKNENEFIYDGENITDADLFWKEYEKETGTYKLVLYNGDDKVYENKDVIFNQVIKLPSYGINGEKIHIGWSEDKDSTKSNFVGEYSQKDKENLKDNVTLYAIWIPNNTNRVNVAVMLENANDSNYTEYNKMFTWNFMQDTILKNGKLLENENVSSKIEELVNDINNNVEDADYDINSIELFGLDQKEIFVDKNTELTLKISRNKYQLKVISDQFISKLSINGKETTNKEIIGKFKPGQTINLKAIVAQMNGYILKFGGWSTTSITENLTVDANEPTKATLIMPKSNIEIEAKSDRTIITYSITCKCAGGSIGEEQNKIYNYNVESETFSLAEPERIGYTFIGWTEEGQGTLQPSVTIAKGTIGDKTYIANWNINPYQITCDYAGGSIGEEQNKIYNYNVESETFTLTEPERVGYEFDGWKEEGQETIQPSVTITKGITTGDKTYIAVWKPIVYTITYNVNGPTNKEIITKSKEYGQTLDPLPTVTDKGYTFKGWFTDPTSGTQISSSTPVPLNGATYYGHWKDETAPTISNVSVTSTSNSIIANVTASDEGSGLATENTYRYYISTDGTNYTQEKVTTESTYTFPNLNQTTKHYVKVEVADEAGNIRSTIKEITTTTVTALDIATGNVTFTCSSTELTKNPITVGISTTVQGYTLQYCIGDPTIEESWKTYTEELTIKTSLEIYARLYDGTNGGDVATLNVTNIDNSEPETPIIEIASGTILSGYSYYNGNVTITITEGDDIGSAGIDKTTYSITGASTSSGTYTGTLTLSTNGVHTITAITYDKLGNYSETATLTVNVCKSHSWVSENATNATICRHCSKCGGTSSHTLVTTNTYTAGASTHAWKTSCSVCGYVSASGNHTVTTTNTGTTNNPVYKYTCSSCGGKDITNLSSW